MSWTIFRDANERTHEHLLAKQLLAQAHKYAQVQGVKQGMIYASV